ncbi:hypothetical protein HRI_001879000 [Hibiscus trionum]|uniref:Integrase catalytic domain-containing protein n=1 Tax=Hibiscus trionum TaxID=183268 RepID=A0A9W7LY18_HIBTR|nr:hypothetical protein HRI_001878800 [Hibiscus trionum]GMI82097.1 hypothetical protein HRI_001879000 [Hibiscus trionum]
MGILEALRAASTADPQFQQLRDNIRSDPLAYSQYEFHNGLLLLRNRIMVPAETALRSLLLQEFHNSVVGGHAGVTRTFHRLAANFYWSGMRKDVRRFVADCQVCQRMKSDSLTPAGLLQPLPIPAQVFEDISLDFIVGLPKSNGKEAILVVVDRLTKYGHFFSLPRHFDSAAVAHILVHGVIKLHGIPRSIVSDRDRLFLSELWTELARLQGTELCFSSAYHPQSDGQTEALNRCLEMYLRCMTGDDPSKWEQYLAWAEYWYNTSFQSSAGMTPFRALYGRDPPTILTYLEGSSRNTQLAQQLLERDELLRVLKTNLQRAQQRMKLQADKHRRELILSEGSWAFVRLQPYRQVSLRLQKHQKLGPRYFGPYRVLQRIGPVAYKLDLPASTRIHPVFHISQLKPCHGQPQQQITPLPLLREDVTSPSTTVDLEDKVHLPGRGTVMDGPFVSAPKNVTADDSNATTSPGNEEPRRSSREKRAPKNLTNFVRF